jgi:hypothetical protein
MAMKKMLFQTTINLYALEVLFPEHPELSYTSMAIFDWVRQVGIPSSTARTRLIEGDDIYIDIYWEKIVEGVPRLSTRTKGGVFNHVKYLCKAGILKAHPENIRLQKAYYALGAAADLYTQFGAAGEGLPTDTLTKICTGEDVKTPTQKFIGGEKQGKKEPTPLQNFMQPIALDISSNCTKEKEKKGAEKNPLQHDATPQAAEPTALRTAAAPAAEPAVELTPVQRWCKLFADSLQQQCAGLAVAQGATQSARDNVQRYLRRIELNVPAAAQEAAGLQKGAALSDAVAEALAAYYAMRCEELYTTGNAGKGDTQQGLKIMLHTLYGFDEAFALQAIQAGTAGGWQSPIGNIEQLQQKYAAHTASQTRKQAQARRSVRAASAEDAEQRLSEAEAQAVRSEVRKRGINKHSTGAARMTALGYLFHLIYGARNGQEVFDGNDEQAQETALFRAIRDEVAHAVGS